MDFTIGRCFKTEHLTVPFRKLFPRWIFEAKTLETLKGHPATTDVPSEKASISHPKKQLGRWNDPFPFCLGYVILVSLEGICFQLPLSRPYELQGTQCQGCHSQGYWLLLGACGLGTREGFCWKFSTESFVWEGNPREVSTKKGGGMWSRDTIRGPRIQS